MLRILARGATRAIALVAILAALPGCRGGTESPRTSQPRTTSFPMTVMDDDGVSVTIDSPPERIVTFAPSNTEIVYALGLDDRLVGVSGSFDDHPPEARTVEQIGGAGEFGVDPNLEKVVSVQPDLFLAISGGEHWKHELRDLGVPVFTVNAVNFEDLLGDIETIGRLTGARDEAAALVGSMRRQAESVTRAISGPPTSCFFEAYYPPLTTVGPRTFIFDLLERAGCAPVSAGARADYPQWSVDRLVQHDPDVYLVSSESGVSVESVSKRPGFRAIGAVEQGRVHLVDSDLVARPGPRVVLGLRALARALHPGAGL